MSEKHIAHKFAKEVHDDHSPRIIQALARDYVTLEAERDCYKAALEQILNLNALPHPMETLAFESAQNVARQALGAAKGQV